MTGTGSHSYPSGWRTMWVIAMFDLPTDTKAERRDYAKFRKGLLTDGFTMMQFSVYVRHCASVENADLHTRRMAALTPPEGEVRFLTITDRQYGRIQTFWGKKRQPARLSPSQLELF
jgi:CRISPR-associated protein Cas2